MRPLSHPGGRPARSGVPVAELSPLRRHRVVAADAAIAMFRKAPSVDAARFRADLPICTRNPDDFRAIDSLVDVIAV
jgi:antitoxin (DNA-binding transcriptional repressor) of toxin-antitoxin stability system